MVSTIKKTSKTPKVANPEKIAKTDKVIKAAKPVKAAKAAKAEIIVDAAATVEKPKATKTKPVKMDMTHLKRLSAGQRIYIRRLKQTARQNGTVYRSPIARQPQAKKTGK